MEMSNPDTERGWKSVIDGVDYIDNFFDADWLLEFYNKIKDEITSEIHIFYKEPKLKKNVMFYCLNDEEHKVIWIDWHPNQTPEYTYQVDSYENYLEKTWWEQHYGYRIAP